MDLKGKCVTLYIYIYIFHCSIPEHTMSSDSSLRLDWRMQHLASKRLWELQVAHLPHNGYESKSFEHFPSIQINNMCDENIKLAVECICMGLGLPT